MRQSILFLVSALLFASCQGAGPSETDTSKEKRYQMTGTVISVDRSAKKASIAHEKIPGFMDAMTMDFVIKEEWVFEDLKPDAKVNAELVVDNTKDPSYWLEKIVVTSAPKPGDPPLPKKEDVAVEGKRMVDFALVNQDGKKITTSDFEGTAWALTFIYSECPLPNFCIAMSKNFSDIANEIAEDDKLKEKIRLLSISFDPERDTPEKLKSYGLGYLGKDSKTKDFSIWQLAVGKDKDVRKVADFFGLRYEIDENDKTQFNHSLRTAVITPEGKVAKVFSGSDWKTEELSAELKKHVTHHKAGNE